MMDTAHIGQSPVTISLVVDYKTELNELGGDAVLTKCRLHINRFNVKVTKSQIRNVP